MLIRNLIIHHTGGTDAYPMQDSSNYSIWQCDVDHKNRFKMAKSSLGWYVGYHYYIDKKGFVTQTRKDTEEGAHCVGWNNAPGQLADRASIGICLAGNFDATLPTDTQITALKGLLKQKVAQYGITPDRIVPHRAHAPKSCYGNRLTSTWARDLLNSTTPLPTKPAPVPVPAPIYQNGVVINWIQRFWATMTNLKNEGLLGSIFGKRDNTGS